MARQAKILAVASAGAALAALVAAIGVSNAAGSMTVRDARPVAKAIEMLEQRYGLRITYEDPPYVHGSDIEDVTRLVSRSADPPPEATIVTPRERPLSFNFPATATAEQESAALEQLVGNYNAARGADAFRIQGSAARWHVVPHKTRGTSGRFVAVTPVLDTKITIAPGRRTAFDLIDAIVRDISSRSKTEVALGIVPMNALIGHQTTVAGSNETARAMLDRLFDEMDAPLSWQLFYDPGGKSYFFNVHLVAQKRSAR
jgi:hypothetical protein